MTFKKTLAATATLLAMGLSAQAAQKERVIVKFTPGNGQAVKAMAKKAGGELKVDLASRNAFAMEVPSQALKGLRNNPNVEYVETDAKRKLLSTNLNTTEVSPWGIAQVEGDVASDTNAGNRTVCIIDSGYDINHSDLSSNNVSGTNDPGTGNWYQAGGSHGTHVAGTVAAVSNGSGVVGVMPNGNVNLHIIKVFNESGWGYSSSLIAATDDCANAGADVISMSLGGGGSSVTERNAFQDHLDNGILSIAAAGNDGNTAHSYPASYDGVVSVAATDESNQHAYFSQRTNQVELSGPGVAVLSSVDGDGSLGQLDVNGVDYFTDGVVPPNFYNSSLSFDPQGIEGSVSGTINACNGTSCPDMTGNICVIERGDLEDGSGSTYEALYPEVTTVDRCIDAGAEGVVVYSRAERPAMEVPFLLDLNNKIEGTPVVGVNRATGLDLVSKVGQSATLSVTTGDDWAYYNGTSMATPHVSAVAALAWSYHTGCSAVEVRDALQASAEDLDTAGRDNKTGYGLVKAQAAIDYLATQSCGGGNPPANEAPTADFSYNCTDLSCSFDGSGSSDSDGSIVSYDWSFGGSGVTANHTFGSAGTYNVTLTVTDDDGATDVTTQSVTVSDGGTGSDLSLSANGYKVKGRHTIDLTWSGATSSNVDIYRNGSVIATTSNDGAYTDATNNRGGGSSYTYEVCEAGTSTCSDSVTVNF